MADVTKSIGSWPRTRDSEAKEFRLIFMASFVLFLVAAAVARLVPRQWRPGLPGVTGRKSIIGEARAAASTFIPFAFMG